MDHFTTVESDYKTILFGFEYLVNYKFAGEMYLNTFQYDDGFGVILILLI